MNQNWLNKVFFLLIVYLSFFTALKAEAFYCNYALQSPPSKNTQARDLDTYIDMFTDPENSYYEARIKALHAYLLQTRPLLLTHEIEHVLNTMIISGERTRPAQDVSLRRATEFLGLTQPRPLPLRFESLSLESQITLFLIKRHLEQSDSLLSRSSALLAGQLIDYVVSDIQLLWPNRNSTQIYAQLTID